MYPDGNSNSEHLALITKALLIELSERHPSEQTQYSLKSNIWANFVKTFGKLNHLYDYYSLEKFTSFE